MKPTLIFDYDGTIHNTMVTYEYAFRSTYEWLVREGEAPARELTSGQMACWLGINSREIWRSFLPEASEEVREAAGLRVVNLMVQQAREHKAVWYPKAEQTLDRLRDAGYRMVVLSNCKIAYREAHWEEFEMGRWFSAFYDCESYHFAPKAEIVRDIVRAFPGSFIVIGDRKGDLECARAIESPFIGCGYGFGEEGELDGADEIAKSIRDLPEILQRHIFGNRVR